MMPKAFQKPLKVNPPWSLLAPKFVFGKLHLDCARVYGLIITYRPLPKSSPGHSKKASSRKCNRNASKNQLWGVFGSQGGAFGYQGSRKGRQREVQATKGKPKECFFILVAPFVHRFRGAFGEQLAAKKNDEERPHPHHHRHQQNRSSCPLRRPMDRKSSRKQLFFPAPDSLVPVFLQEFLKEVCSSLVACKHILRRAPQCRTPKARWRFGPQALYIYIYNIFILMM